MKRIAIILLTLSCLTTIKLQAQHKNVTLDYYFNNEFKKNQDGILERFHYTWEDASINGYSIWGGIFKTKGYQLKSLENAPTASNLKGTDIYIITDPDTQKESPNPHFMDAASVNAIRDWVKEGGVLVMMTNDSANAELPHFNLLAEAFGMHYTDKVRNSVIKDISVGKLLVPEQHEIFKAAKVLYMKGISTITVKAPASFVLEDNGDVIMAKAKYGKGTVIALVDPWIYNEYIVNDRLNASFQNGIAAVEFTDWLIKQVL